MSAKLGLPWDTNREENCECPCQICLDTIGYDPETPCDYCPIDHEQDTQ